ncbi:MAG: hypothetical protein RSF69_03455 [Erysipelotrichaceae bacterium]
MKESLYLNKDLAIVNYSASYARTFDGLMNSATFKNFVRIYIDYLQDFNVDLYYYALNGKNAREANFELCKLFRQLTILNLDEIDSSYLNDKGKLLNFIEELYNFWKQHQRFSIINSGKGHAVQESSFIDADTTFNDLIRGLYRKLEQKVQGRNNSVYRQLQAGTNACVALRNNPLKLSTKYDGLKGIPFIDSVMLRTPMILHPKSNKRIGSFDQRDDNPIASFTGNKDTWFCYPCKIGSLLAFIYLHRDFISSGISLANLFELASDEECKRKPDLICLFGNEDNRNECTFHFDEEESIWIGCVSYHERIEYFGYIKKMSLTLHNLAMMAKGWLPIHGAFVNVTLKNGKRKGIMLMGDSGAGKSESIEALRALGNDSIRDLEVVFDDMGSIHLEDGVPFGQGTEIGAFIRLDDLDKGTPYRDMDRSIFMNPDSLNARVITPAAPYEVVASNHKIDMFVYANNYDDKNGIREIDDIEEAKAIYTLGKRMALGTTQEVGISTTYFANPFGPMQQQELCGKIIDEVFAELKKNHIFVGEIFTHLGFSRENREGLNIAAQQLLAFIEKD